MSTSSLKYFMLPVNQVMNECYLAMFSELRSISVDICIAHRNEESNFERCKYFRILRTFRKYFRFLTFWLLQIWWWNARGNIDVICSFNGSLGLSYSLLSNALGSSPSLILGKLLLNFILANMFRVLLVSFLRKSKLFSTVIQHEVVNCSFLPNTLEELSFSLILRRVFKICRKTILIFDCVLAYKL